MTVTPARTEGLRFAGPRVISQADFYALVNAQGVAREDTAFTCVTCGTVQSMRSLVAAGATPERAENTIGFSCEGRLRGAKGATRERTPADPNVRGCDWSLGGLFTLHTLEVEMPDGKRHRTFELATPEQAQALEKLPL